MGDDIMEPLGFGLKCTPEGHIKDWCTNQQDLLLSFRVLKPTSPESMILIPSCVQRGVEKIGYLEIHQCCGIGQIFISSAATHKTLFVDYVGPKTVTMN
jgi:hypothetical protein